MASTIHDPASTTVREAVAVVGEDAAVVAEALLRSGSPPIAVEEPQFVLLAADVEGEPQRLRDLAPASLDMIVMRRAWSGQAEVGPALAVARRALRPGGRVMAGDIDASALASGALLRYPARFLYDAAGLGDRVRQSVVSPTVLATEMIRAGFRNVSGDTLDEVRGRHESIEDFWVAARGGRWRGLEWVDPERRDLLFESVAPILAKAFPVGPVVDREPWFVVDGVVP